MRLTVLVLLAALGCGRDAPVARFSWPAGTELRYAVDWRQSSHARVQERDFDGGVELEADLVLTSRGPRGDATLLRARLEHVQRQAVTAFGQDLRPVLEGAEALVEIDARGRVRAVHAPAGVPGHVLNALLTSAQITLPEMPQADWTAIEDGPQARAEQRYRLDGPLTLRRDVARLDAVTGAAGVFLEGATASLSGSATAVLDPAGHLRSLHATDALDISGPNALETRSTLSLVLTSRGTAPDLPPLDERALDTHIPGELARGLSPSEIDRRFAGDLTIDTIESTVDGYARGIGMPNSWVARATAFGRVHPELIPRLAAKFRATSAQGRELVFDLLSGTGTPEAQAAMRELLDEVADPWLRAALLQRFSFVWAPEPATLDFLADGWRAAEDPLVAHATLYPLGSAIGAYRDRAAALVLHDELVAALAAAEDPDDKVALLAALGNAGLPEGEAAIAALVADAAGPVRAQAARSLRKLAAREPLFALLADPEAPVARSALATLASLPSQADDLRRIAELVEAGRISRAADAALISFASARREPRILAAIAARSADKPELAARARDALAATLATGP